MDTSVSFAIDVLDVMIDRFKTLSIRSYGDPLSAVYLGQKQALEGARQNILSAAIVDALGTWCRASASAAPAARTEATPDPRIAEQKYIPASQLYTGAIVNVSLLPDQIWLGDTVKAMAVGSGNEPVMIWWESGGHTNHPENELMPVLPPQPAAEARGDVALFKVLDSVRNTLTNTIGVLVETPDDKGWMGVRLSNGIDVRWHIDYTVLHASQPTLTTLTEVPISLSQPPAPAAAAGADGYMRPCEHCKGSGNKTGLGGYALTCEYCNGTGIHTEPDDADPVPARGGKRVNAGNSEVCAYIKRMYNKAIYSTFLAQANSPLGIEYAINELVHRYVAEDKQTEVRAELRSKLHR